MDGLEDVVARRLIGGTPGQGIEEAVGGREDGMKVGGIFQHPVKPVCFGGVETATRL